MRQTGKYNLLYCCYCSVGKSCPTLCNPMDCSTPGFPVLHYIPEFIQIHVHWVGDAIQPSHPLLSSSLPAFNLSQLQSLFQWVDPLYQVTKVLELRLQHQSFQWIFRIDSLISVQSKGYSGVFSSTTIQNHQFSDAQHSLWFNSHIRTCLPTRRQKC